MTVDSRYFDNALLHRSIEDAANELVPALAMIISTGNWREFVHPMRGLQRFDTFQDYLTRFLKISADVVWNLLPYCEHRERADIVADRLWADEQPGLIDLPTDDVQSAVQMLQGIYSRQQLLAALDGAR